VILPSNTPTTMLYNIPLLLVSREFQAPIFSAVQEPLMASSFGFIDRHKKIVTMLGATPGNSTVDKRRNLD
jgi:hypothetical protein